MEQNKYPGKFIAFEGLDGSGQSTQAKLLADFLAGLGFEVVLTKEPAIDFETGRKIQQALDEKEKISPERLQELFVENRKEHLEALILPALRQGKVVIVDRYFFSTFAFGASDGLDLEWLIGLNDGFLLPDITFILKVRPEVCVERIEKRGEGIKLFEKVVKLRKVWQTYKLMPSRFKNISVIYGERSIEDVFSQIKNIVVAELNIKQGGK